MNKEFDSYTYPKHQQQIEYFFSPFEKWYVGEFIYTDEEGPLVVGAAGFSTWHPEVTKWRLLE